jgi:hypothetical protein
MRLMARPSLVYLFLSKLENDFIFEYDYYIRYMDKEFMRRARILARVLFNLLELSLTSDDVIFEYTSSSFYFYFSF